MTLYIGQQGADEGTASYQAFGAEDVAQPGRRAWRLAETEISTWDVAYRCAPVSRIEGEVAA